MAVGNAILPRALILAALAGDALAGYQGLFPWPPLDRLYVRPPPTVYPNHPAVKAWIGPPSGFQYGNWWVSHSSNPSYAAIYNLQDDAYPVLPSGIYPLVETTGMTVNASSPPIADLTSYNAPNTTSPFVITAFGYDFPRAGMPWVFDFHGTGHFNQVNNTWEVLAWGYDANGAAYFVPYESAEAPNNITATGAAAGIDVQSRTKGGPDAKTYAALVQAFKNLGIPEFTSLVGKVVVLPTDGRRDGQPPVACDATCVDNVIFSG